MSPMRFHWTVQNGSRAICHTSETYSSSLLDRFDWPLAAIPGNWLRRTVILIYDSTSFLPESWIVGTVYRRRQLVRALSTSPRGTWKEWDRWRWVFHGLLVRLTQMLLRASTYTTFSCDYLIQCMNYMVHIWSEAILEQQTWWDTWWDTLLTTQSSKCGNAFTIYWLLTPAFNNSYTLLSLQLNRGSCSVEKSYFRNWDSSHPAMFTLLSYHIYI